MAVAIVLIEKCALLVVVIIVVLKIIVLSESAIKLLPTLKTFLTKKFVAKRYPGNSFLL